jgi:hypothetical protein
MKIDRDAVAVRHNEAEHRYEAWVAGRVAHLDYRRTGTTIYVTHTDVPAALEGQGIASMLAQAALDDIAAQHLTIVPLCPFVAGYIRTHPRYQPLVAAGYRIGHA